MAEISSTPDLSDPLGAPKIVTGPEYMEALGKLGYNVENMTSMLPTITKIAEAGSSLLDQAYNQNLEYQKAQGDLAYKRAQAGYIQSEADYNNASLDTRIKQLGYEADLKKNEAATSDRTLEGAIAAINAKNALSPQLDQATLDKSKADARDLKAQADARDEENRLRTLAQQERDAMFAAWPKAEDPDYDQKVTDLIGQYPNAIGNPNTSKQVELFMQGRAGVRSQNATVQLRAKNLAALQTGLDRHSLGSGTDIHALSQNPQAAQAVIAQSNIADTLTRVQSILNKMPATANLPPEIQQQAIALQGFANKMRGILTNPEQGMNDVRNGLHGGTFDADGNLSPDLEGDLQAMEQYYAVWLKRAAEEKPPETTVTTGKIDQLTRKPITETQIKYFGQPPATATATPAQATAQAQQPKGVLNPLEQQNVRVLSTGMQQRILADPAFRAIVDRALTSKSANDWRLVYKALGVTPGGVPKFQTGGYVDPTEAAQPTQDMITAGLMAGEQMAGQQAQGYQTGGPALTLGSTDTVPAMLSPGEFVMSEPATQAIGVDKLNRMNQAGSMDAPQSNATISSTPDLTSPLEPIPSLFSKGDQGTKDKAQPDQQQKVSGSPLSPMSVPVAAAADAAAKSAAAATPTTTDTSSSAAARSPSQVEPSSQIGGNWTTGIGTEFGEVDNPAYGGYTEAGWNKGKWGDNISGWSTEGVALPNVPRGTVVEVRNPKTGATTTTIVKDAGPGAGTGANIDMLAGTRAALGLPRDFKGQVQYRIVSMPGQQTTQGYQRGGVVTGGEMTSGKGSNGEDQGGGDYLQQQRQPHRRFHPKLPGQQGPDIPDEMQKKLAKLAHDYLSGLSGLIQAKPEMGPQLLRHARTQLAANIGTGAEDEQQQQEQTPEYSPAAYAMTAQMGAQSET